MKEDLKLKPENKQEISTEKAENVAGGHPGGADSKPWRHDGGNPDPDPRIIVIDQGRQV